MTATTRWRGRGGRDTLTGGAGSDVFTVLRGQGLSEAPDVIADWSAADRLRFGQFMTVTYAEATAATFDAARTMAASRIGSDEVNFLSVQVGGDVYVFAEAGLSPGTTSGSVLQLAGRTLADISAGNIIGEPPAEPKATAPATRSYSGSSGSVDGDVSRLQLSGLLGGDVLVNNASWFSINGPAGVLEIMGTGFTYQEDANFVYAVTGGTVNSLRITTPEFTANVSVSNLPAVTMVGWALNNAVDTAMTTIFGGDDALGGRGVLRGYGGNDKLDAQGLHASVFGGQGDDQIFSNAIGDNTAYLRGDEGADYIEGFAGFDDINGNMGTDTATGGQGNDWVVGGKDSDLLFGDEGHDLVYGNLGADTCYGGAGNDTIRGGQENDACFGGAGNDFVSGDKGDDTMTGGAGADLFHTFGDAGLDRVTDFSVAEGDRVMLDPGTQHTAIQVGDDVVIDMVGGGRMVLVGVQLSSLPEGWIFGG